MKNNFYCLNQLMGVEEAAELWGLAPGSIKNLCASGKVIAVKIGKTWVIPKNHPNPKILNQRTLEIIEEMGKLPVSTIDNLSEFQEELRNAGYIGYLDASTDYLIVEKQGE